MADDTKMEEKPYQHELRRLHGELVAPSSPSCINQSAK
jgi:hypothetical protein